MNDADTRVLSLRRRHPAFSRLLLYGTGLLILLVALLLLRQRAVQDAADHEAYLTSRLDQLDLLNFSMAEGRQAARQVLDDEYRGDDLSPVLRARVLRIEAQLDARDGEPEQGVARLAEAKPLLHSPDDLFALCLEEATLLQLAGRGEEALLELEDPTLVLPASETLRLHHVLTLAWVQADQGNKAGAREGLEAGLARWQGAPDEVSPTWVGTVRPTAVDTWIQATRFLCQLSTCGPEPWLRLAATFPRSLLAASAAARGLLEAGAPEEAAALWARVRTMDPEAAGASEAQWPVLKGLGGIPEEGLKPEGKSGR